MQVPGISRDFHYWQPAPSLNNAPMTGRTPQPSHEPPSWELRKRALVTLRHQWKRKPKGERWWAGLRLPKQTLSTTQGDTTSHAGMYFSKQAMIKFPWRANGHSQTVTSIWHASLIECNPGHTAVFKQLSKVITRLRLISLVIGLRMSCQYFNQREANPKPLAPGTRDFSRALSKWQVIARNSDWFIALFAPLAIGGGNNFFHWLFWARPTLPHLFCHPEVCQSCPQDPQRKAYHLGCAANKDTLTRTCSQNTNKQTKIKLQWKSNIQGFAMSTQSSSSALNCIF